jgi:DNA-binding MarR family transcriptional regulator
MALQETPAPSSGTKAERRGKFDKNNPVDPHEALEGMLIAAHRVAVALGEINIFQESGLSVAEWAVLKRLGGRQDVPMKEVVAAAGVSRQRFQKLLSELRSKGLVEIARSQGEDKRARKISTTPTAARVLSLVSSQLKGLIPESGKPKRSRSLTGATRAMERTAKVIRKTRRKDAKAETEAVD